MEASRKVSISDFVNNSNGRKLTVSYASWLLEVIPASYWISSAERQSLEEAVQMATQSSLPRASITTGNVRKDHRDWINDPRDNIDEFQPKIYSDYEYGRAKILENTSLSLVDDINEANFILTTLHIRDFYELPPFFRVNQFPYEGGFVRKDLLLLTVRGFCYENDMMPKWWLPAFDLSTEFHYFVTEVKNRQANIDLRHKNRWILKPSQGTRAVGHYFLEMKAPDCVEQDQNIRNMIMDAAVHAPMFPMNESPVKEIFAQENKSLAKHVPAQDKIAQLLVECPLLVRGLKFDLRTFVFVRSFVPFEAYMHRHHYARLANKAYDINRLDDNEIALTVNAYNDDEEIANKQARIFREPLRDELKSENPKLNYRLMMNTLVIMFTELFEGLSPSVGYWPGSSAYYAVDVLFDSDVEELIDDPILDGKTFVPQAKVLEINFMGDWEAARLGSKSDGDYCEWINDIMICMTTKKVPDKSRHIRLGREYKNEVDLSIFDK